MTSVTDIHQVYGVDDLIGYFASKLGWNIDLDSFDSIEDVSYELGAVDLGVDERALEKIKSLRQLRPFDERQKWGMFCLDLDNWKFSVSALRNVLNGLVFRKRDNPNARIWNLKDLLFLCEWGNNGNRWVGVAHFKANEKGYPLVRSINCAVVGHMVSEDALRIFEDRLSRLAWPVDTGDVNAWSEAWSGAFDTDFVQLVEGILEDHQYISWETLCKKMLGIPGQCADEKMKLFKQLEEESQRPGSSIGIVSDSDAENAVINKWVVYSSEWMKSRFKELNCKSPAETIGMDLYARIQKNKWWYNDTLLNYRVLEDNDCNHIVKEMYFLGEHSTLGVGFKQRYGELWAEWQKQLAQKKLLDEADKNYMEAKQLIRERDAANGGRRMIALAEAGYPLARYELGRIYEVQEAYDKAEKWYSGLREDLKTLAEKGNDDAVVALAYMHFKGKDGPEDRDWAITTLKDLYEKGNVASRELLPKISPEDVPVMNLEICSRRFGKVQVEGVEYVVVGNVHVREGRNFMPVVCVDAKPNKLGEYRAYYVSRQDDGQVAIVDDGEREFKYVPKCGVVSRYHDPAKTSVSRFIYSTSVVRFLESNNVRTGAEFMSFMKGNDLTGYRGVGPKKIAQIRSEYEELMRDYEDVRFE